MKNRIGRSILGVGLLLGTVPPLHGQSTDEINATLQFNFSNPGARSLGLGGAFIARADDATAVYANPAGLLQLTKPELTFDLRAWEYSSLFLQGGSQVDPAGPLFETTDAHADGLSFLSAFYPSRSGRWGVGVYRHESARFENTVSSNGTPLTGGAFARPLDGRYSLKIENLGISMARRFGRGISLGGSVFRATLDLDSRTERLNKLRFEIQPPDPSNPPLDFTSAFGNDAKDLANYQTQKGDDSALGFTLGGLWHSRRRQGGASLVSLGTVYRRGPEFEFQGSPFERRVRDRPGGGFFHFFVPRLDPRIGAPLCPEGGCVGRFKVPDVLGFGISIRPSARWVVALDIDRLEYSDLTDVTIDIVAADAELRGGSGAPSDFSLDDGTEIRLGGEYAVLRDRLPDLFFRAGAWLDPDHRIRYRGRSRELDVLWAPGEDELHWSAGMGLRYPRFQFDAAVDISDRVNTLSVAAVYYFGRSPQILKDRRDVRAAGSREGKAEAEEFLELSRRRDLPDYQFRYLLARRAQDRKQWNLAAALFSLAEEAREAAAVEPPEIVRVYGTLAESYLPNYHLGVSLYGMEDYAGALRSWERTDPALSANRNRGQRAYLETLRRDLPDLLAAKADRIDRDIRREQTRLEALTGSKSHLDRSGENDKSDLARRDCSQDRPQGRNDALETASIELACEDINQRRIEILLCASAESVEEYRRSSKSDDLLALAEQVESGAIALDRARAASDRLALLGAGSEEAKARIEREKRARKEREAAFQAPAGESCGVAIARLTALALAGPIAASEEIHPYRELATAAAGCRKWEQSVLFLELARKVTRAQREAVETKAEEVAWRLGAQLEAEASAAGEHCDPSLALELNRLAKDALLARFVEHRLGGSPEDWAARAFQACEAAGVGLDLDAREAGDGDLAARVHDDALAELLEARARIESGECGEPVLSIVSTAGRILRDPKFAGLYDGTLDELGNAAICRPGTGGRGQDFALVIGASSYSPPWPELDGPQDDVFEVGRALRRQGFDVTTLLDPTAADLLTAAAHFAATHADRDSRLLVYFAGHGQTHRPAATRDPNSAAAFLVPVDAGSGAMSHPLPLSTFKSFFRASDARQKLFIFDSCFAGNLIHQMNVVENWEERDPVVLASAPVESILTAGGDEQKVPDFSVFRRNLIEGLFGRADYNGDRRVMAHELARYLQEVVPPLTAPRTTCPQFGIPRDYVRPASGLGDMEFAVIDREAERDPGRLAVEIELWRQVWGSGSLERYRLYDDWFGAEGVFADLARGRAAALQAAAEPESDRWLRVLRPLADVLESVGTN